MMKVYLFLVAHIYSYYKEREANQEDWYYLSLTSIVVAFLLLFNIYSLFIVLINLNDLSNFTNKYYFLFSFFIFWLINHLYIIKNKKVIHKIETSKKGMYSILIYFIMSVSLFILIVQYFK